MSAPKFTPGPWSVRRNDCGLGEIATIYGLKDGYAEIWSANWLEHGHGADVNESNLVLIAAAPELYAALAYAVDNPEFDSSEFDRLARAALAKAAP